MLSREVGLVDHSVYIWGGIGNYVLYKVSFSITTPIIQNNLDIQLYSGIGSEQERLADYF